ncbi:MAG TPA: hypothetical protein VF937_03555 [Chloroflexota bacterium]
MAIDDARHLGSAAIRRPAALRTAVPATAGQTPPAVALSLAALSIALIFGAALILPVPFWRAQPAAPSPSTASAASDLGWPAILLALAFGLALTAPYRPYLLALRVAARVSTRTLVLLTVGLALTALLIFPSFGSDLFVYLDYERLWAVYGANPLLAFPNLHPEDWAFRFVWIPQQPSPYGPLWPLLTWPIARVAGDSLWAWIGGYKLLSLTGYVTCCALIWFTTEPARRKRALLLFAWSPLVLFEVLGKAHNDSLLAVSALATVSLARRHPVGGMLAATAGMLVKLSGLAVVLGLAVWLARARAWRTLALGSAAALGLTLALYAPFWAGPETLRPVFVQTSRVVWSPGALIIALASAASAGWIDLAARALGAVAWATVCVLVARRATDLARDTAWLLVATLLLLTTAFFAHYLVPVVALAAVAGHHRLERLAVALSIGSLAAYSVELLGPGLPPGWIGSPGYQALGSLLTLAPAALVAFGWLRRDAQRA